MADNVTLYPGTGGSSIRSTDVSGQQVQHVTPVTAADAAVSGATGATTPTAGVLVMGDDGANARALRVDSAGNVYVRDLLTTTGDSALAAHGTTRSGQEGVVNLGAEARSTLPTAVDDADPTRVMADLEGRQVVAPHAPRALHGQQYAAVTASPTTVVAAGAASVKRDLVYLNLENADSSAATVTLKDSSGGSTVLVTVVPANSVREFRFSVPLKQTTAANLWEVAVTTGGSINLHVTAQYVETKQ